MWSDTRQMRGEEVCARETNDQIHQFQLNHFIWFQWCLQISPFHSHLDCIPILTRSACSYILLILWTSIAKCAIFVNFSIITITTAQFVHNFEGKTSASAIFTHFSIWLAFLEWKLAARHMNDTFQNSMNREKGKDCAYFIGIDVRWCMLLRIFRFNINILHSIWHDVNTLDSKKCVLTVGINRCGKRAYGRERLALCFWVFSQTHCGNNGKNTNQIESIEPIDEFQAFCNVWCFHVKFVGIHIILSFTAYCNNVDLRTPSLCYPLFSTFWAARRMRL